MVYNIKLYYVVYVYYKNQLSSQPMATVLYTYMCLYIYICIHCTYTDIHNVRAHILPYMHFRHVCAVNLSRRACKYNNISVLDTKDMRAVTTNGFVSVTSEMNA